MKKIMLCAAFAAALVAGGLTGCEPKEEVKSVMWYKAPENKAALEEKLAWCRKNKEKQGVDQSCINAETAFATSGSFQKVEEPPVPKFSSKP